MRSILHNLGAWRSAVIATLIYLGLLLGAWLTNLSSPSGPCTPGLGVLLFFLLPIVNMVWLMVDVVKSVRARNVQPEILIHTIVLVSWMSLFLKD